MFKVAKHRSNSSSSLLPLSLSKLQMRRVIALILYPVSLDPQCYMVAETAELNTELPKKKINKCIDIPQRRVIMSEGKAVVSYRVLSPVILSTLQLLLPLFFDLK